MFLRSVSIESNGSMWFDSHQVNLGMECRFLEHVLAVGPGEALDAEWGGMAKEIALSLVSASISTAVTTNDTEMAVRVDANYRNVRESWSLSSTIAEEFVAGVSFGASERDWLASVNR